jgi:hypothetical protein
LQGRPARLGVNFFQKLRDLFKGGRSTAGLAEWLELPEPELLDWLRGRPPDPRGSQFTYRQFEIPKRAGGTRTIEAPSDALKALQRRIMRRMLNPLPIHPAATGFVRGHSIVHNARPHAGRGAVINLDLKGFFHSIERERVYFAFRALGWGRAPANILANICTHEGRLPQGAPTSPALSNVVCRRLDARLSGLAAKLGGQYTRYADDITVSFPHFGRNRRRGKPKGKRAEKRPPAVSRGFLTSVKRILESEGFQIQMKKKVRVQRPHQRQTATGLVVNRTVNLPRAARRRIRAMQHRERMGQLGRREAAQLRGWESLVGMVARQRSE